jgi:HAD superfamily hydrolase (TIGR01450 family)
MRTARQRSVRLAVQLSQVARQYDQFILDLDGCVWVGGRPLPGAVDAIGALREAGKPAAFVTNNPREAGEEYVRRLWGIGVQASLGDVVTVGGAVQHLLHETRSGRTAFVIGSKVLRRHVADANLKVLNGTDLASRADLVVVGGTDEFDFADLRNAVLAVQRGAELVATSRDRTYPMPDGMWPGAGAVLAAVEYATERTAAIVGKPEPRLIETAVDRLGDGRTLVVGDSLGADVGAAAKAGLDSALVLTGGTTREEAEAAPEPRPQFVADSLGALILGER